MAVWTENTNTEYAPAVEEANHDKELDDLFPATRSLKSFADEDVVEMYKKAEEKTPKKVPKQKKKPPPKMPTVRRRMTRHALGAAPTKS